MNKFKKPRGGGRDDRPVVRPRFGAPARLGRSPAARPQFGGARRDVFQKFDAVCSNCGKACQVPFRPDGKKPVYCKDCFGAPREVLSKGKANEGKSTADLTRQIAAMNTKIDAMLKILRDGAAGE